jgi:hypothetical protein
MLQQQAERQRQTQAIAASIHQVTVRALAGDPRARAASVEGDLGAIVRDVNLLLQRLAAAADGQSAEPGAAPLVGLMGSAGAAGSNPPAALPVVAEPLTPQSADPGPQHDILARRLQRVQELASELTGALAHSQDGLDATASATAETQRAAGASVALAHELLESAQHAVELVARARRALAPQSGGASAASDAAGAAANGEGDSVSFLGLGTDLGVAAPGLTGQFQVLPSGELAEIGAADALAQAPVDPTNPTDPGAAGVAAGDPAPGGHMPDLPELEGALSALREAIAAQERGASALTQDLGIISRHVRGIDGRVAWARQAIDAVRRNAERLYLTAGGATPPPTGGDSDASALPSSADSFGPTTTRPLADAPRSYPSMPPAASEQPAASESGDHEIHDAADQEPDAQQPG